MPHFSQPNEYTVHIFYLAVVLLGFEQASYTVLESSDEPLSIIVTKSGRNERPVTVSVIKVDGTATRKLEVLQFTYKD